MTTSKTPAFPRRAALGGSMSTEQIKARIEAMFPGSPAPTPNESGERKSA
ncbi:hypothetical protein [Rhodococcus sp. OK302]|nr:hypothetical protein [Rhodococcus sp. OK302]